VTDWVTLSKYSSETLIANSVVEAVVVAFGVAVIKEVKIDDA